MIEAETPAEALAKAAQQFRSYEAHHQGEADAITKQLTDGTLEGASYGLVEQTHFTITSHQCWAVTNAQYAEMCERGLVQLLEVQNRLEMLRQEIIERRGKV